MSKAQVASQKGANGKGRVVPLNQRQIVYGVVEQISEKKDKGYFLCTITNDRGRHSYMRDQFQQGGKTYNVFDPKKLKIGDIVTCTYQKFGNKYYCIELTNSKVSLTEALLPAVIEVSDLTQFTSVRADKYLLRRTTTTDELLTLPEDLDAIVQMNEELNGYYTDIKGHFYFLVKTDNNTANSDSNAPVNDDSSAATSNVTSDANTNTTVETTDTVPTQA